ncbi:MAG TPA: hypothetical protein VIV15_14530 [Anaerolineales bacterium]
MIGAAIDIDSTFNPHLEVRHIRALDRMLIFIAEDQAAANNPAPEPLKIEGSWLGDLPKLQSVDDIERARVFYNKTVAISEATKKFLTDFLTEWQKYLQQKATPADPRLQKAFLIVEQLVKAFGGPDKLVVVQQQGLISIPAEVFIALDADPDIQWGNYTNLPLIDPKLAPGLDTMHFEVTPKVQERVIGKGYP